MFEKPVPSRRRSSIAPPPPAAAIPGQPNTFALPPPSQSGPSRQSTGHGRRSSIQNIAAVSDVGEGSVDMSIEESDDGIAPQYQDESEEEDMSMEMTQSYGGGIIHQQQQVEEGDESFMTETSTRSDEEKTMDFTVAIGGFLPPQPPSGAKKGRASLGYTHLDPTGSQNLVPGEEEDMEMDETVAFGGIINNNVGDDTISTNGSDDTINGQQRERTMTFNFGDIRTAAAEEQATMDLEVDMDMSMDMTTVGGGIHSQQHTHIHAHAHVQQPINIFAQSSTTPKSPHRTITKPSSSTPSFARPTTSSAQKAKSPEKAKRNIFGPSPSPAKSMTPRKSGMGIAGEVAKRLSFGSASGSVHGSAKRTRPEEEDEEEMVKRQKHGVGLGDSIFGRPRLSAPLPEEVRGTPRKSLAPAHGTPRKILAPESISRGTPRKSMAPPQTTPARPTPGKSTPAKSPRKSIFPTPSIDARAEEEEEEMSMEMEEEVRGEDWEAPPIGLTRFLEMAGVEFVDELPILSRRKSGRGLGEGSRGEYSFLLFPLLISFPPLCFGH
jgi:kinetochore protein Spc7/SPC105